MILPDNLSKIVLVNIELSLTQNSLYSKSAEVLNPVAKSESCTWRINLILSFGYDSNIDVNYDFF